MIFCGQCGLQLPPGVTQCPRCGTTVELDGTVGELHPDDPTIASTAYTADSVPPYVQPPPQAPPRLVLRPGANAANYSQQGAYDTRSRAGTSPTYGTPATPQPGYTPGGGNYQTQNTFYPPPSYSGQYPPQQTYSNKGRTTGLIFILLGLLLILSAVVLLALQHNGIISSGDNGSWLAAFQAIGQHYSHISLHSYQIVNERWY